MRRVAVAFDGFNFYYGLRDLRKRTGICYYWSDLRNLASWLVAERTGYQKPDSIVRIAYCTARIKSYDTRKKWRQKNYLDLLSASGIEVVEDEYFIRPLRCPTCEVEPAVCHACLNPMEKPQEKQTDVNLAMWAIIAAYQNVYDDIILVTSDCDLAKVPYQIHRQCPDKKTYIAIPPEQVPNFLLTKEADGSIQITEDMLIDSIMRRRTVIGKIAFTCPREWEEGGVVPR